MNFETHQSRISRMKILNLSLEASRFLESYRTKKGLPHVLFYKQRRIHDNKILVVGD
jgi:hypothetical protein